jgi:hypothetical protein
MAYIRSANPSQFPALSAPGEASYVHGADTRRGYIPLAFQVTSPFDELKAMMPHALVSHVNPSSFSESFTKKIERIQTRGGFVEQHWGDELSEISVEQSTGAFINLNTGLSSLLRQRTIAWDRYQDLFDLYRNDGNVYDPFGNVVLKGWVMVMFDRGTYLGSFRSFQKEETDDSPFTFKISWSFKVEKTLYQVPNVSRKTTGQAPSFAQNLQTVRDAQQLSGGVTQAQYAESARTLANQNLAATLPEGVDRG